MTSDPERGPRSTPEPTQPRPGNRFSEAIDRSPTVATAATAGLVWAAGTLALLIAVFPILAGVLLAVGSMGSGWQGRVTGVGLIAGGAGLLAFGRWATYQWAP